jgi:hypothetical protein
MLGYEINLTTTSEPLPEKVVTRRQAIADFTTAHADQSEKEDEPLTKAVRGGRLETAIDRE